MEFKIQLVLTRTPRLEKAMNAPDDTKLKIEVVLHRPPEELARLRSQLPALEATVAAAAELAASETLRNYQEEKNRAVEYFLQGAVLQPLDLRKARMAAQAMRDIFAGTEWLTADQVGTNATFGTVPGSNDPRKAGATKANRWKNEGKIFAIQRDGKDWYPRYQFDVSMMPIPLMKTIIQEFGDVPRIEIAAWMESPNIYLNGKRPREVVATDSRAILAALTSHFDRAVAGFVQHA
jgi:hypothetical protein